MPLPSPELIGLTDPREVSGELEIPQDLSVPPARQLSAAVSGSEDLPAGPSRAQTEVARARPSLPRVLPDSLPKRRPRREAAGLSRLAPEDRTFVQIMVAAEVRERLADASYALEDVRPGCHLQQTIVGALISRHVDPEDPQAMDALLVRLAAWTEDPLSQRRGEALKLGWRLPHSLTRRLDKAVLRLKATHRHLTPSAKALLASLIMSELKPDTPLGIEHLVNLVVPYVEQYERPLVAPTDPD